MKNFTSIVKMVMCITSFTFVNLCLSQNSGVWTASGSGASTTWSTTAGGIGITASATSYGSGTSYTLNDFQTHDTMGCNNSAYSDGSIVGNPSLSIRHTFPNTAQITFNFSTAVENPVLHFDRLGGGQVSNKTSSSLVKILTPGITYTRLSGNDVHFECTSTTVGRKAGQSYTSLPSECGPPLAGTASGSARLNGVFSTITFEISMDAVGSSSSINDRFEIAFSDVRNLTLDFDGVDDYINRSAFLGNNSEVTMMSWIKLDNGFDGGEVMGQRNFRIFLDSSRRLKTYVRTNGITLNNITTPNYDAPVLETELWYHVAALYDASKGTIKLFLNGELEWEYNLLLGSVINNSSSWNSNHDFEIGRNSENDNNYFEGSIYETRVYTKALTDDQLQKQVYQEIENNSGQVRGTVIPKDIDGLSWSDLKLYYKMDVLNTGKTPDESISNVGGNLHNMRTYQDRTAPLPYVTRSGGNGDWDNPDNWLYGSVWDIPNKHNACAIIKIADDITTDIDHSTIGLIVENGKQLTIEGDSGLFNSWYVKLDGKIDLVDESQFIQTEDSDLDTASSGSLEKDQQGTKDLYTYNYWSSPVGVTSTTSNNTSYKIPDVLRNGTNPSAPTAINFINGYDGSVSGSNISIAKYWIWKFSNLEDDNYSLWQQIGNTGTMLAGEGYTMKGVSNTNGSVSQEQNYVFVGKPNNGTIELQLDAGNDYLVGNPYPSAIDARQFILDNGPLITGNGNTTGTLYFWEHWGGGSHLLAEYQGGYSTYNLSGGVPAASKAIADEDVDQSSLVGTKTPGRYIPVGQGFFVIGEASGKIEFNNGQRVFVKEDSGSSVFLRGANNSTSRAKVNTEENNENGDNRMKIRLGFDSVNSIHRQLLVTVDEAATMDYDWGFDGILYEDQMDDMYWMIDNEKYIIQGINEIDEQTSVLPLGIHTNIEGNNSITIDSLENVPDELQVLLHDMDLNIYHNLRNGHYNVFLPAGDHLDRFEIVFTTPESLSTNDNDLSELNLYYSIVREKVIVLNPNNLNLKSLEIYSIEGQSVYTNNQLWEGNYGEYEINNLSTGVYIVKLKTDENVEVTKKIIVK